jgi:hypothetical protein
LTREYALTDGPVEIIVTAPESGPIGVTTLPSERVSVACAGSACIDIAFTGSLSVDSFQGALNPIIPPVDDLNTVRVGIRLLLNNVVTPDLQFGPSYLVCPEVTLPYIVFGEEAVYAPSVPIAMRYVSCQPAGLYDVAIQLVLLDVVGASLTDVVTVGLAMNGVLTVSAAK